MSKFEQYSKNAEEAQRQTHRAASGEIRTAWLRLVQGRAEIADSGPSTKNRPFYYTPYGEPY